jgi:hypothetical protein
MKLAKTLLLPLALAALAAAPARADEPCRADAQRLCQGIPPGGGRMAACLQGREADLSPACRDKLALARMKAEELSRACLPDVQRFCQGIPPGKGRILACLKGREADLAPACQAEFRAARERAAEFRQACAPDVERYCKRVRPGQGRILACLKGREADLSQACRAEFAR